MLNVNNILGYRYILLLRLRHCFFKEISLCMTEMLSPKEDLKTYVKKPMDQPMTGNKVLPT